MSGPREMAIHEAGHAAARWWLDRRRVLGRRFLLPPIDYVAVKLSDDVSLFDAHGCEVEGADGLCVSQALVQPVIEQAIAEQQPQFDTAERRRFIRRAAAADCIQSMAGPIAEYSARGEPFDDWFHWDSELEESDFANGHDDGTDHWKVRQRLPLLGRQWRGRLQQAFETADHIAQRHQPHIEALAAALVQHGYIDGEEVYRLFDATGPAIAKPERRP